MSALRLKKHEEAPRQQTGGKRTKNNPSEHDDIRKTTNF